jgi:hypothetical protein
MSKEIFKDKRGNFLVSENIYNAICDVTYDYCDIKGIYDKYTRKGWREACEKRGLPNLETVHEFLKQFLPQEL